MNIAQTGFEPGISSMHAWPLQASYPCGSNSVKGFFFMSE